MKSPYTHPAQASRQEAVPPVSDGQLTRLPKVPNTHVKTLLQRKKNRDDRNEQLKSSIVLLNISEGMLSYFVACRWLRPFGEITIGEST